MFNIVAPKSITLIGLVNSVNFDREIKAYWNGLGLPFPVSLDITQKFILPYFDPYNGDYIGVWGTDNFTHQYMFTTQWPSATLAPGIAYWYNRNSSAPSGKHWTLVQ